MKKVCLSLLMGLMVQMTFGQTLEKMQWFNEPEQWEIKNNVLSMSVTPQSDYWRISHYGFTVDDAPFYYATYGGEFEAKVKVVGEYKERFDQAGLMLRIDHENYIKAGIEFVDGKFNLSTVVTHKTSDWSVITLDKTVPYIWINAITDNLLDIAQPQKNGRYDFPNRLSSILLIYSAFFFSHSTLRWSGRCFTWKYSNLALNPLPSGQAAISPTFTGI